MNKHPMFITGAFLFCLACTGENLLTNSSFEETVPFHKSRFKVELVKDWICQMNNGSDVCNISLASPGASGKYALRLSSKGKGFNSAIYGKNIPVSAGAEVTATVKLRGKGQGFFRIWFLNRQGKKLGSQWNKHYIMHGMPAGKEWKTLAMKITVPDKVARIQLCLETLGRDDDVLFDDVSLEIQIGRAHV